MKTALELREKMSGVVREYVPKWRVISKADSKLHRFLSWLPPLIFFRKSYMEDFWTTIGFTAASPVGYETDWDTIAHEGLHGIQFKKWSRPLMGLLYTFPQSFLIPLVVCLALLVSPWFWFGMLLAAAPLPAPWRMLWELEAYKISVMTYEWQWSSGTEEYIDSIASYNFAGPSYYFMWPFTKFIKRELDDAYKRAYLWNQITNKEPYIDKVFNVIKEGGRLAPRYR